MLRSALLLVGKDLRLTLSRGAGLMQAVLLGLLLIFVFSLAQEEGETLRAQAGAAMFWLATAFCQVLIFSTLYGLEEPTSARLGLALMPAPLQAVWLGKDLAGLVLLLISQLFFLPAAFVFLGQSLCPAWLAGLGGLVLVDVGMAAAGSLLGALSTGQRESLLSIVVFPLMAPLLLSGIRIGAAAFSPEGGNVGQWLGMALAFDALFLSAGLVLFPFVYSGED